MKNTIRSLLITMALCASTMSFAEWSYEHVPLLNKWVVSDGKQSINFNTEKGAKKATRALNKNEKKNKKKEERNDGGNGFWNDGSDHCANPLNEC